MTASVELVNQVYGADQFLAFLLGNEQYAVDILRVQEIRPWQQPMPIPNAPPYIKGVINIRGEIVPIADLRERLGFERFPYGPQTVVVVVKVEGAERSRLLGVVVDGMSDVYNLPEEGLKEPPDLGDAHLMAFARGVAMVNEQMVTVLNLEHLFGNPDEPYGVPAPAEP